MDMDIDTVLTIIKVVENKIETLTARAEKEDNAFYWARVYELESFVEHMHNCIELQVAQVEGT
jgi:hypothetical protein